jgi:hypothetical protein
MRRSLRMLILIKRLVISLLGAGAASVAAYQTVFRLAWWQLKMAEPHADGQAGMGRFFGAAYVAMTVALVSFTLLF